MGLMDLLHQGEQDLGNAWDTGVSDVKETYHHDADAVEGAFQAADKEAQDPTIAAALAKAEDAPVVGGLVEWGEGAYHIAHSAADTADGKDGLPQYAEGYADQWDGAGKALKEGVALFGELKGGGDGGGDQQSAPDPAQPAPASAPTQPGSYDPRAGQPYVNPANGRVTNPPPMVYQNPANGRVTPEPPMIPPAAAAPAPAAPYDGMY